MAAPHTRGRLFVVGSANEDLVVTVASLPQPGQMVLAHGLAMMPGGKGANQAVAAARAGADVVFVGAVGRDAAGERTIAALRTEGVDVSHLSVDSSAPTGVALVTVADDGENHIAAAATSAEQVGAAVLVNPPPARTLIPQVLHARPILLPNASEAAQLSGLAGVPAARWLHDATGAPVVMTIGSGGATVVDQGEMYVIGAPVVDVVDTTGAGDTFAGVLAAMLAQSLDLHSAVEEAVLAAAKSVTARGARSYATDEGYFGGSERA